MEYRKLNIIGDIDEALYHTFVEELDALEEILEGDDIYIELMSHGGDAMVALALFDRIRRCKGNVIITAYGFVASAAVLILAAGDVRRMAKNAWAMVHEDTTHASKHMKVSQVEAEAKNSRRLEDQWCRILEMQTGIDKSIWADLHSGETYLDASECQKYGLADKII